MRPHIRRVNYPNVVGKLLVSLCNDELLATAISELPDMENLEFVNDRDLIATSTLAYCNNLLENNKSEIILDILEGFRNALIRIRWFTANGIVDLQTVQNFVGSGRPYVFVDGLT